MKREQFFLKGEGAWYFSYLIFSKFIIFTFRNYFTLCKTVLYIWRKIFFFFCHHNFMKKRYSKLFKMNLCVYVKKVGVSDNGRKGIGAEKLKYLKKGVEQKRREGKQKFLKKGGSKLGQDLGTLKRGAKTPLRTMHCRSFTSSYIYWSQALSQYFLRHKKRLQSHGMN